MASSNVYQYRLLPLRMRSKSLCRDYGKDGIVGYDCLYCYTQNGNRIKFLKCEFCGL